MTGAQTNKTKMTREPSSGLSVLAGGWGCVTRGSRGSEAGRDYDYDQ